MTRYKIEWFSNDDQYWMECEEDFSSIEVAARFFKRATESDPDMAHRILETKTIALYSHGETLNIGGL